jgi:hypothetical protein
MIHVDFSIVEKKSTFSGGDGGVGEKVRVALACYSRCNIDADPPGQPLHYYFDYLKDPYPDRTQWGSQYQFPFLILPPFFLSVF